MPKWLTLSIYNFLLPLATVLLLPKWLKKHEARGGKRGQLWQRFGKFPDEVREKLVSMQRPVWIHAVSVGEVGIAIRLVGELKTAAPEREIVLTTTTATGYELAQRLRDQSTEVLLSPIDLFWVAKRFLQVINPSVVVLVESEIWPNLIHLSAQMGVPVMVANLRLSPKSEQNYRRARGLLRPIFAMIGRVMVPHQADVARAIGIGIAPEAIVVTGSVKFDPASMPSCHRTDDLKQLVEGFLGNEDRPIFLGASTHPGEEALLAEAWVLAKERIPDLVCFLVPRHFERAGNVLADLQSIGLNPVLRSQLMPTAARGDVLVIDSTGELGDWTNLASVVAIGKSFRADGGQNPVEAVLAGKPVITGPRMENFATLMEEWLEHPPAVMVVEASAPAIADAVSAAISDRTLADTMVANAQAVVERHRGAAERTAQSILAAIKS